MEPTTQLQKMLLDHDHSSYNDTLFNRGEYRMYQRSENTIYLLTSCWDKDYRDWLGNNGIVIDTPRNVYVPVARLEGDNTFIGYNTQFPNMANKILTEKILIPHRYPNLYWVDIGNHPYPKEARQQHNWQVKEYLSVCHKIVHPDYEPKNFFRTVDSFTHS